MLFGGDRLLLGKRPLPDWPAPPLKPPHQDPQRSAQTPHALSMGRDWPVKPTIRQVIGQFWGCERKGDFSIVVPLGGKRRDSQRKKVLNSPRNRQTSCL